MKYFLIFLGFIVVFLIIRLMDKENPLIGKSEEQPFLERMKEYQPEKRPESLPDSAVWRGGLDGGVYIVLPKSVEGEADIYYAEVYYDSDGELIYKGRFRHMHSEYSTKTDIDLTQTDINIGWDGENLYLDDGQYLQPLSFSDKG